VSFLRLQTATHISKLKCAETIKTDRDSMRMKFLALTVNVDFNRVSFDSL